MCKIIGLDTSYDHVAGQNSSTNVNRLNRDRLLWDDYPQGNIFISTERVSVKGGKLSHPQNFIHISYW